MIFSDLDLEPPTPGEGYVLEDDIVLEIKGLEYSRWY